MTFEGLKQSTGFLLLDCVSGSQAYGLAIDGSDVDKKGIFILPKAELFGFEFTEQVSSEKNDEVYFEVKRFLELLTKNNPNILELLNTPAQYILYRHSLMHLVRSEDFLSKLCLETFAGYAQTQIKKAKGLNKKINNPMAAARKSVLDFCYVIYNNGSTSLVDWLEAHRFAQEECGLVNVEHFRNVYLLFHQSQLNDGKWFAGIISGDDADDVQLSSVPKGINAIATITFNKDGYSKYCKDYREYREWEQSRNAVRYENTITHGKNYDAKNMMHTFRLLNMAEEIALYKEVRVHRDDREFLLGIRSGNYEFDDLMKMVDDKMQHIQELFEASELPERPDTQKAEQILLEIREQFYK